MCDAKVLRAINDVNLPKFTDAAKMAQARTRFWS